MCTLTSMLVHAHVYVRRQAMNAKVLWLRLLVCINDQCLQANYSMEEHTCLRMRAFIAGGTMVARSVNSFPSNAYRLPTYTHVNPAVRHEGHLLPAACQSKVLCII